MERFADIGFTDGVIAAQHRLGSRAIAGRLQLAPRPDGLGEREQSFIAACESFFIASVGQTGWPYVQHRGGAAGVLQAIDAETLAMPDFSGNRQYLSLGNLSDDDRVALILVDYSARRRLKLLGHANFLDAARAEPALVRRFSAAAGTAMIERYLLIRVVAFDWNCPQHIPLRYSAAELAARVAPLQARIDELESRLRQAGLEPPAPASTTERRSEG